jgi:tight adherence protein C
MPLTVILGAGLVATAVPVAWWSVSGSRTTSAAAALQRGLSTTPTDLRSATLERPARERAVAPMIDALVARARRATPAGLVEKIEQRLAAAGALGEWTVERVITAKIALAATGLLLGVLRCATSPGTLSFLFAAVLLGVGWFTPDVLLDGRADDRRKDVQRELADVMDQITIAVEAGLGFEAAVARVSAHSKGVLADELSRTLQDIQLGVPRAEALDGLAQRCDVAELRHFVTAVRQAERYGLPIANVLRIQSAELRDKRRQRAEEHAMKIPVKVLFPLMFCILPTMFIVIIGPGIIRIVGAFSH